MTKGLRPLHSHAVFLALALSGCATINIPGPYPAPSGTVEVGADYRPHAVNRWFCESIGSIVLASKDGGYVFHHENRDWVVPGTESDGVVIHGYHWTVQSAGYSSSIAEYIAAMNAVLGETWLIAATTPGGSLEVEIVGRKVNGDPVATKTEQCVMGAP